MTLELWPCEHECEPATVDYREAGKAECRVCGRQWEPVEVGRGENELLIYGTSCTVGHGGVYFPKAPKRGRACIHNCPLVVARPKIA